MHLSLGAETGRKIRTVQDNTHSAISGFPNDVSEEVKVLLQLTY